LRQDESILLKRIIGVQKQASTTKTYQSLNIQELIYIITIMKMKLWIRLESNEYTGNLIKSVEEEYKRELLEENIDKNKNDGLTQKKKKKKKYQDKSLLLEIKELYQLFNIEKFDTNNIKMIENSLNKMENEQIRESDNIHLIKYCINNRYKDISLEENMSHMIKIEENIRKNNFVQV
jgi:hypothetical protein